MSNEVSFDSINNMSVKTDYNTNDMVIGGNNDKYVPHSNKSISSNNRLNVNRLISGELNNKGLTQKQIDDEKRRKRKKRSQTNYNPYNVNNKTGKKYEENIDRFIFGQEVKAEEQLNQYENVNINNEENCEIENEENIPIIEPDFISKTKINTNMVCKFYIGFIILAVLCVCGYFLYKVIIEKKDKLAEKKDSISNFFNSISMKNEKSPEIINGGNNQNEYNSNIRKRDSHGRFVKST